MRQRGRQETAAFSGAAPLGLSAGHLPDHPFRDSALELEKQSRALFPEAHVTAAEGFRSQRLGWADTETAGTTEGGFLQSLAGTPALRAYTSVNGKPAPDLAALRTPPQPLPRNALLELQKVPFQKVDHKLAELRAERWRWLGDLTQAPASSSPVVPEDLSFRPSRYLTAGGTSQALAFAEQLLQIGQGEGFEVLHLLRQEPRTPPFTFEDDKEAMDPSRYVFTWIQDSGEWHLGGGYSIPSFIDDLGLLESSLEAGRAVRLPPHLCNFPPQGLVEELRPQRQLVALGVADGAPLRQNLTYLEGGNVLPGVLPSGEHYALVGKDSVAISKALLERDIRSVTGFPVTLNQDQVREAIAKDLGIQPQNVFLVEQPGTYHLDMSVGLLGPGEVVLNDARASMELQLEWMWEDYQSLRPTLPAYPSAEDHHRHLSDLAEWTALRTEVEKEDRVLRAITERTAQLEDLTAKDLEGTGLKVHRAALAFQYGMAANFLNSVKGTNPAGERFNIALGADPRAEATFLQEMQRIESGIDRFYFLDRILSADWEYLGAGVNCRTKAIGGFSPARARKD